MIAASEPLEFVPAGRQAVEEHPGENPQNVQLPSELVLLQRMQNVNLSAAVRGDAQQPTEFWCVREVYEHLATGIDGSAKEPAVHKRTEGKANEQNVQSGDSDDGPYMCEYIINSEEELYVKKHTAVWTRGLITEGRNQQRLCFTCETPIKFAFFAGEQFVRSYRERQKCQTDGTDTEVTAICLIDQNALRVYCSNGEDFLTNLEFPVSHVWSTQHGVLLEKIATSAVIQNHTISMPRLFSLAHPLDEICPVLNKSATNVVSYLIESEYKIIFSQESSDLLLLYDNKINKHFISRLRRASDDEIQCVGSLNETLLGNSLQQQQQHSMNRGLGGSSMNFSQNSMKFTGGSTPRNSTAHMGRCSFGNNNYSMHISKMLSAGNSISSTFGSIRNSTTTPLNHLQTSLGQHSLSMHDIRKVGHSQPSKAIVPQLCLEHIWTENTYGHKRDQHEIATRGFLHTDLVGQTYLCYLLPRSGKLQLVHLGNFANYNNDHIQIATMPLSIVAKDALALERMKMIAVLDGAGSLLLYTGHTLVSKVHVSPLSTPITGGALATPINSKGVMTPENGSFPRRSSLLPTVLQKATDNTFEEELHMLSPVHPLQPQFPNRNSSNVCIGLRDAAGNRLTLSYPTNKMFRISLPLMNESQLISRCIQALRQILTPQQFTQMAVRWYNARNPPGSVDYSVAQEWRVFRAVLYELMGCGSVTNAPDNDDSSMSAWLQEANASFHHADEPKKRKKNNDVIVGTDDDWEFMSNLLRDTCDAVPIKAATTATTQSSSGMSEPKVNNEREVDTAACLFASVPAIFFSLHLLYEDFKLDESLYDYLPHLAKFLHQLAIDMQLSAYTFHYALDYPQLVRRQKKWFPLTAEHGAQMHRQELLLPPPCDVYQQLGQIVRDDAATPYAFVEGINDLSRNVLQVISLIMHGHRRMKNWFAPLQFEESAQGASGCRRAKRFIAVNVPRSEQVIQMLISMRMKRADIERLPVALHLIIAECLEKSRLQPPIGCSATTYELILRSELVAHVRGDSNTGGGGGGGVNSDRQLANGKTHVEAEDSLSARSPPSTNGISNMEHALDDGMDNIDTKLLSLRFPDDMRVAEVRRLLISAEPALIDITQSPGTSDHEFIEEQEKHLFALCTRTMALPLGRGMFTMRTSMPTPTESMPIPKLCLTGKEPVKGATVEMQQIEFPANMSLWPTFHNGVAAGLKISPHARDVDSTWIVYNKPKGQIDISTEHAGFLMALGLNGHLKTLSFMSIYDYLVKCDEMTSVGLLLGISATHRGTMDNTTTKLLSVHIEALLPATALELDIPQNIQVASLLGIGLVFAGTAKRHITEVLLQEVGRPPGPEMENSVERESYALAAGLALGLVTLGQGEAPAGLRDLQLPDTLHYYMVGGTKRPLTGSQKEKYRLPSFQVREGDMVNIDVTAPGATLGLGLMFFDTSNRAVAEWMNPPNTRYLLNLVRPDLLLLRTIARGLILWSEVRASEGWLFGQFPKNLQFDIDRGASVREINDDVDHEAITQAYCNITAGAAFCIGLKYAGTENPEAFKTLRKAIKMFLGFPGKYVGEFAGRTTIESSLMLILLSISLVFAGSGDLEILRIIRYLRSRIGPQHAQVTYGSHMAIHMSLGFLFLGAGRFTIAKTPEAVAALVCALFPKFPNHSTDNRYHLQAFRHLYVLAVEPRLFLPRDIDTKKLCLCSISVLEIGHTTLRKLPMAPCILPELSTLQKVVVDDPNYWPVSFERDRNWQQLLKIFENSGCVDIKKRMGCLSHLEDPDRLKSLLAQTLTTEQYLCWELDPKMLNCFSNEAFVVSITDRFLHVDAAGVQASELSAKHHITLLFYNAVIKDKIHVMPIYWALFNINWRLKDRLKFTDILQMKLIETYLAKVGGGETLLFSQELVQAQLQRFRLFIDGALKALAPHLRQFIAANNFAPHLLDPLSAAEVVRFMTIIRYYDLRPNILNSIDMAGREDFNYLHYLMAFKRMNLPATSIYCLLKIMQCTAKTNAC